MTATAGTVREESQAMEFSVNKSALLNELSTTQGVVERKTTIPILSNLLVEAKGARLAITATDLELSIRTSCEAKVKKDGAGTIPAKKLLELVRLLPEGEIKFKLLENHWVEIVATKRSTKWSEWQRKIFRPCRRCLTRWSKSRRRCSRVLSPRRNLPFPWKNRGTR